MRKTMRKTYETEFQGERLLTTFNVDKENWREFRMLMVKENRPAGDALNEFIEKYLKEHGDGNPQFTLEHYADPNFIACPAFYRDGQAWQNYMNQATPEELEKLKAQIILIDRTLGRAI